MNKRKTQSAKRKVKTQNLKFLVLNFGFTLFALHFTLICFAQEPDLEFTLDVNGQTIILPRIFKPNIDLSGRGFHPDASWPQTVAAREVLDIWQKDIGFNGVYRLQYNLWEINQLAKDKELQNRLLSNYENIIKAISDAGGIVILDIFGMPAGIGKVLDKKSPPRDLRAFKEIIKNHIRHLSCDKRYNIWYEVWSAPDLDEFFLGRKQEYLNLYRQVAEAISELEAQTKIHIPLGGPGLTWWFQNLDGNTVITPEGSLIYELIKFCYHYHLPLDFITWYGYSSDPKVEKETTVYHKSVVELVRDWLSYFNYDRHTPLLVDEWNYDRDTNLLPERKERAFVCASYIPARIKNMYEAGIDYQLYFSLEDFQNNKEDVVRNTGIFGFDSESLSEYKGGPKAIYNVFRMLTFLGQDLFLSSLKLKDEFVGVIATKDKERIAMLIYNYIDPEIVVSYLSREIANLNSTERKLLLNLIKSDKLEKIMRGELDISTLRKTSAMTTLFGTLLNPFSIFMGSSAKLKTLLKAVRGLNVQALNFSSNPRNIKIDIKNLKGDFLYKRWTIDSSCSSECNFAPAQEKEISAVDLYQETLGLTPYSVNLVILEPKPKSVIEEPQDANSATGNKKE